MLSAKAVTSVRHTPHIINPLGVVARPGSTKLRLILDMRIPNNYMTKRSFRLESLADLRDIARSSDVAMSLDMVQGYYHVTLHPDSRTFCGFEWRQKYYIFAVLPFGMRTAPRVFAKTMHILVRHWRSSGVRMIAYLDDWLFVSQSQSAQSLLCKILADCKSAHIRINLGKSQTSPVRIISHLGFECDLSANRFTVPTDRWNRLQNSLRALASRRRTTARELARLTGQIVSMGLALGAPARLFTRSMFADINSVPFWGSWLSISSDTLEEIEFWTATGRRDFTSEIFRGPTSAPSLFIAVDASDIGWGAHDMQDPSDIAHGYFIPEERAESSTHREIRGVFRALISFDPPPGSRVLAQVDCLNLSRVVPFGSRKASLASVAKALFRWLWDRQIKLDIRWVPRELNNCADDISKLADTDDWQLDPNLFAFLDDLWGPFTLDTFATPANALCGRFFSKFRTPGSAGVDAFANFWGNDLLWINPPFGAIAQVLSKLRSDRARAALIIPLWAGRHWWPILFPDGDQTADFVHDIFFLPRSIGLFRSGPASGNRRPAPPPSWDAAAVYIDFAHTNPDPPHLSCATALYPRST